MLSTRGRMGFIPWRSWVRRTCGTLSRQKYNAISAYWAKDEIKFVRLNCTQYMNNIDEMPTKCNGCPYWEMCEEPYVCPTQNEKNTDVRLKDNDLTQYRCITKTRNNAILWYCEWADSWGSVMLPLERLWKVIERLGIWHGKSQAIRI